jgi:tRNA (cmo5U34)-methyltransferase
LTTPRRLFILCRQHAALRTTSTACRAATPSPPCSVGVRSVGTGGVSKDRLFAGSDADKPVRFVFDEAVASVFDDMITRSVPFYAEQQRMIAEIARVLLQPGTLLYELGCSTGATLIQVVRAVGADVHAVGYDSSTAMLARAADAVAHAGLSERIALEHGDLDRPAETVALADAGVVVLAWTLQFVRPPRREALVRWIYDALPCNGALVVADKVLPRGAEMGEFFTARYFDLKRRNRYSEDEIARKRAALDDVLIPYGIDENLALFRRAGFETVETFFQWYNFAGFLCVKQPPVQR